MIDVVIHIVSAITSDETQTLEVTAVGQWMQKNGTWFLKYDETCEDDIVHTVISLRPNDAVHITRTGNRNSRLLIEPGKRYLCHYDTDIGMFDIGVSGTAVQTDLRENGGKIHLEYSVDINAEFVSKNVIDMYIREDMNHV